MVRLQVWSGPFLAITSRSTLSQNGIVPFKVSCIVQIYLFENDSYSTGLYAKKNSLGKQHKKCKYERAINSIPSLLGIK